MKRFLFLAHRWMGIVLCLFMAMWFVSGVVMMYVGYPKLVPRERRAALPELTTQACCADVAAALARLGAHRAPRKDSPDSIRLVTVGDTPRYVFGWRGREQIAVDARNGEPFAGVTTRAALAAAAVYAPSARLTHLGVVDEDAWTHSRALDPHRPLHRIQADDPAGTLWYVSSATGEVVRDATRIERGWNWVGAWLHWLYPLRGGPTEAYWLTVVIYTSLAGSMLALTGLVVGALRWRFAGRYASGAKSPYRGALMRWHHVLGLVCGTVAVTWAVSGLLSVNPWRVFDSGSGSARARSAMPLGIDASRFAVSAPQALERLRAAGFHACELEWRMLDGRGYYIAFDSANRSRIVPAAPGVATLERFSAALLEAHGRSLLPGVPLARAEMLTRYDAYYYARAEHTMTGANDRRLPVLRLEFADVNATWLHLDADTGAVVGRLDVGGRTERWLFALLHSWDWGPLIERRPLWDVVLIVLSLGGFVISATGVVIGWRRLRGKFGVGSRGTGDARRGVGQSLG